MSIGERILEKAKQKRFSQAELSKMLGISQASVSAWKNGSVPSSDKIAPLAEILEVSLEYILTGKEEEPEQVPERSEVKSTLSDLEIGFKLGRLEGKIQELEKLESRIRELEKLIQRYEA